MDGNKSSKKNMDEFYISKVVGSKHGGYETHRNDDKERIIHTSEDETTTMEPEEINPATRRSYAREVDDEIARIMKAASVVQKYVRGWIGRRQLRYLVMNVLI